MNFPDASFPLLVQSNYHNFLGQITPNHIVNIFARGFILRNSQEIRLFSHQSWIARNSLRDFVSSLTILPSHFSSTIKQNGIAIYKIRASSPAAPKSTVLLLHSWQSFLGGGGWGAVMVVVAVRLQQRFRAVGRRVLKGRWWSCVVGIGAQVGGNMAGCNVAHRVRRIQVRRRTTPITPRGCWWKYGSWSKWKVSDM